MKPLNTFMFAHEDVSRYATEAADCIDVLETTVGDLVAVEKLATESDLTLTEKEALHLMALTKKAEDLFSKTPENSPYGSSAIGVLLDRSQAAIDNTREALQHLDSIRSEMRCDEMRAAIMGLDLSTLPAGVDVNISYGAVSELHQFQSVDIKQLIEKTMDYVKSESYDTPRTIDSKTISLLGLYAITCDSWNGILEPIYIDELSTVNAQGAGSANDSVKSLLADIVCNPLPIEKQKLDNYLSAINDTLAEIKTMKNDGDEVIHELRHTVTFATTVLSAIRCWAFIYGTVYNTLVRLSYN